MAGEVSSCVLAIAILATACRGGEPAPGGPPRQLGESDLAGTGETLFVLTGGGLERPVEVPLWIELDLEEGEDELKCQMHSEWVFFELPGGHIYVGQYNSWCGGSDECRILDPAARRFSKPAGGCISPSGVHMRIEALEGKGSWIAVSSDSEGVAWVDYVTYSPTKGVKEHLHVDLAHDGHVSAQVTDSGLELVANFDLIDPPEGLMVADGEVAEHLFMWTEGSGLVRGPDIVSDEWVERELASHPGVSANLDSDATTEHLTIVDETLMLLDRRQNRWIVVHEDTVSSRYFQPFVMVLGGEGDVRPFAYVVESDSGTGFYRSQYKVARLIDGRVLTVLEVPYHAHADDPTGAVCGSVRCQLRPETSGFLVDHVYRFWRCNTDKELVQDHRAVIYEWSPDSMSYVQAPGSDGTDGLTPAQLTVLQSIPFMNDDAFMKAFSQQVGG